MTARRGKSQARRHHGNHGLPGWAWLVLGVVLTIAVVLLVPGLLKSDGDGFFRPQPNPDALPAPSAGTEDAPLSGGAAGTAEPEDAGIGAAEPDTGPEFDFYTLLPGKEVPVSDAELAATQRAEQQRLAALQRQQPADAATVDTLPQPVEPVSAPATTKTDTATAAVPATTSSATAAGAGDGTRYLLQAGAFQASGQAEELKARIALLGLSARVEAAEINGRTVHRVRMGPYGTASDLADARRKLAGGGLPGMAIKVQ